jgi:hypothetical protein
MLSLHASAQGHQFGAVGQHGQPRRFQVGHVEHLNLADHHRLGRFGLEAAAGADELGGVADGRQDARLLDGHGDEVVAAVDQEVDGDAQRQGVGADDVLDHQVGLAGGQPLPGQHGPLGLVQFCPVADNGYTLGRQQLIEARQARRLLLHSSFHFHVLRSHTKFCEFKPTPGYIVADYSAGMLPKSIKWKRGPVRTSHLEEWHADDTNGADPRRSDQQ